MSLHQPLKRSSRASALAIIVVAFIGLGCSTGGTTYQGLLDRISNRGPVPLSGDNPYLVGNLFLSRLTEQSPEVAGFLKTRGTPQAIEVEESFWQPALIRLYYPQRLEFYSADQASDVWAITGPHAINAELQNRLSRIATIGGPAKLLEGADSAVAAATGSPPSGFQSPPVDAAPSATSTPIALIPRAALPPSTEERVKALIAKSPQHPAEQTPRGDLVHYVTFPGETLSMLARWYTLDVNNATRIARINKLATPDKLSLGESLVIPSYMVQNRYRLTDHAVQQLKPLAP